LNFITRKFEFLSLRHCRRRRRRRRQVSPNQVYGENFIFFFFASDNDMFYLLQVFGDA